ncbi:MAG: DoxX family membrane protein [Candidatus Dormiibacterota bacterium]
MASGIFTKMLGRSGTVTEIPEPKLARFLFADKRLSWLWLIVRVYVGWQWVSAAVEKIQGPGWIGSTAGVGLKGFVSGSIAQTAGAHPAVQGWYGTLLRDLVLSHVVGWSYVITFGELACGVGLILGIFTGIAAFSGAFMNMNYMMAGAVSINPVLLFLELLLILAWRIAGYLGVDFALLPLLGTPWSRGSRTRQSPTPFSSQTVRSAQ